MACQESEVRMVWSASIHLTRCRGADQLGIIIHAGTPSITNSNKDHISSGEITKLFQQTPSICWVTEKILDETLKDNSSTFSKFHVPSVAKTSKTTVSNVGIF